MSDDKDPTAVFTGIGILTCLVGVVFFLVAIGAALTSIWVDGSAAGKLEQTSWVLIGTGAVFMIIATWAFWRGHDG